MYAAIATPPRAHCTPGYAVVHPFESCTSKHAANSPFAWFVKVIRTDALVGQRTSSDHPKTRLEVGYLVGYTGQIERARLQIENAGLGEAKCRQRAQRAEQDGAYVERLVESLLAVLVGDGAKRGSGMSVRN